MNNNQEMVFNGIRMRQIPGFPSYYASEHGNIHSFKTGMGSRGLGLMLKAKRSKVYEYQMVHLREGGEGFVRWVHRVVCLAWNGPCPKGMEVSHRDGDNQNNRPENLLWETRRANMDRRVMPKGTSNTCSKFDEKGLAKVKKLLAEGKTVKELSQTFGCAEETIRRIKVNKRYVRPS